MQRHEAAAASGLPEPALSAFRYYQLMFPVLTHTSIKSSGVNKLQVIARITHLALRTFMTLGLSLSVG